MKTLGLIICILSGLCIMGGIQKIGKVCTYLTPIMACIYVAQTAVISNTAWKLALGGIGDFVVTMCLALFCFSTIIGWCTYGETSWEYLFGSKSLIVFRVLHVIMTFVGCVVSAQVLWDAADFCNGVMCIPNLFSLIIFAGLIAKDTKKFIDPME